jgi:hypothetical protein
MRTRAPTKLEKNPAGRGTSRYGCHTSPKYLVDHDSRPGRQGTIAGGEVQKNSLDLKLLRVRLINYNRRYCEPGWMTGSAVSEMPYQVNFLMLGRVAFSFVLGILLTSTSSGGSNRQ